MANFNELLGQTIVSLIGASTDSEEITIFTKEGYTYKMYHYQDCCESVSVEDIIGDTEDLMNTPITMAEEVTSEDASPEGYVFGYEPESYTWTFYKLATVKGYVTIRWLGQSNGYYSESVTFKQVV